jgi:hypothetical protein
VAGNLEKPLLFLYGTEWMERGHGLYFLHKDTPWPPAIFAATIMAGEKQPLAAEANFGTVGFQNFCPTRQPSGFSSPTGNGQAENH